MPAVLLLVLATLFWAGNYLVAERAVETLDPVSLTWWRWALASVPLLVLAQVVERPDWRRLLSRWRILMLAGLLGVGGYALLLYAALERTSAINASIVNALAPAAIVVAAVLLGQATADWRAWTGGALGLLGVLLVLTRGDLGRLATLSFNSGDVLMLGAVAVWTAYTLIGRRLGLPVLAATAVQVVLTTIVLTPVVLLTGFSTPPDRAAWGAVLFIVVFPSVGSYLCWNLAIGRVPAGVAGTSMNLVAVFTVAIAALLGQPPTAVQLIGGALVISGVVLASRGGRRARPVGAPRHGIPPGVSSSAPTEGPPA